MGKRRLRRTQRNHQREGVREQACTCRGVREKVEDTGEKGQEEMEGRDEGNLLLGHAGLWRLKNGGISKTY